MPYSALTPDKQKEMRDYVQASLVRFTGYRDTKETMAFAGLAVFLGAVTTALTSQSWPPHLAERRPFLIISAFSVLWLFVAIYLRYQLRRRRWAAIRAAGCDWLLAEWLPDSPRALANEPEDPEPMAKPGVLIELLDLVWPLKASVTPITPKYGVYPQELERSWILASKRGTDAIIHERLIHCAAWIGYLSVIARTIALWNT